MQTKTEYNKEQFLCQTFFCTGWWNTFHSHNVFLSHLVHQFPIASKNPGITVVTDEALISEINVEVLASLLCLIKKITYHLST